MDPCPFLRITIANLVVLLLDNRNLPSTVLLDCNIKLKGFPTQVSTINAFPKQDLVLKNKIHASFNMNKTGIEKLTARGKTCCLKIEICATKSMGIGFGYYIGGRILGSVFAEVDLKGFESKGSREVVIKNGWVLVGLAKEHLNVKVQLEPRFIFQFDGEPECSPLVFQVNGNLKQPVFTCNFSLKNPDDWNSISRSSISERSTSIGCFNCWTAGNDIRRKQRKGWLVTIHDLFGSPIVAASMVTPFVPSQGSNRILYRGFVMSSMVKDDGKCSKPKVIVRAQHVSCSEGAAVFVALGAAIYLSMDACQPFS
nr:uncharacterized protein LOC101265079 [Solanum lycopersicum]